MLLYADDTVCLFGTDEKEIQNNLDMFYEYSELWYLSIDFNKTKIMIFSTRQGHGLIFFYLGGQKIDICTDFKYLGVIFVRNRYFHQTKKHNVEQARKAMHVHFKRIRNLNIPVNMQLYLSDHVILWFLSINFDKTEIMIFGTRQEQCFNFYLSGHKIDICTDL